MSASRRLTVTWPTNSLLKNRLLGMEPNFTRLAVGRPRLYRSAGRQLTDDFLSQNTLLEEEPNWTRLAVGWPKWPFRLTGGWPVADWLCTTAQFKSEFQFYFSSNFLPIPLPFLLDQMPAHPLSLHAIQGPFPFTRSLHNLSLHQHFSISHNHSIHKQVISIQFKTEILK